MMEGSGAKPGIMGLIACGVGIMSQAVQTSAVGDACQGGHGIGLDDL